MTLQVPEPHSSASNSWRPSTVNRRTLRRIVHLCVRLRFEIRFTVRPAEISMSRGLDNTRADVEVVTTLIPAPVEVQWSWSWVRH